jgi:predicted amidohydrolase YtcJ
LLSGRLIALSRIDGHARWVSPAVLDLMPDLPDKIDGGLIVRDGNGKPTGTLLTRSFGI